MKFQYVRRKLGSSSLRILDIGCGNGSPSAAKRWFPGCHYSGADVQRYNLSDEDVAAMDAFFPLGMDGSGYAAIPEGSYDLVLLNHVVEHMAEPAPILATLCAKLKPGGYIWIAFPSLRSLSLPPSVDETLQFCDDPTHVYVPDVREVANILLANGVKILHAGRSREGFFTTLGDIVKLVKRLAKRVTTGRFSGRGLWYLLGFEDHVFGQRSEG
ncbi:MAG TPA: class I SAM-dependent methyltransferase [Terracidiphilus sp.]|nr:class I SAM-dependent methyltransferase [Terracidiphilus sp.]